MVPKRWKRQVSAGVVGALALLGGSAPVGAATTEATGLADFDTNALAAVVDFKVSYPTVFPYRVSGGVLEAMTQANGTGNAAGIAGPMPVDLLANAGAVYPTNIPTTDIPAPEEGRKFWQSVDWGSMPNYCRSNFPDTLGEGRTEQSCGGPMGGDANADGGVSAAAVNGYTKSTGNADDPLQTRAMATSRGTDVSVASQVTIHHAWSQATSGLNERGLAEGHGLTEIDNLTLLDGLIQLKGLRSEAVATSDGTAEGSWGTTSFQIRDASVDKVPVVIGREGVKVDEQALAPGKSVQEAADQMSAALKGADAQIRLIPAPAISTEGAQVSAQSAGVEIVHRGSSAFGADSIYRFGFTAALATASRGGGEAVAEASSEQNSPDIAQPVKAMAVEPLPAATNAPAVVSRGSSSSVSAEITIPVFDEPTARVPARSSEISEVAQADSDILEIDSLSSSGGSGGALPSEELERLAAAMVGLVVLGAVALPIRKTLF